MLANRRPPARPPWGVAPTPALRKPSTAAWLGALRGVGGRAAHAAVVRLVSPVTVHGQTLADVASDAAVGCACLCCGVVVWVANDGGVHGASG